jgi:hypothetical protein
MKHRRRICLVGHIFLDPDDKWIDTKRSEQSYVFVQLLATINCLFPETENKKTTEEAMYVSMAALHFLANA